MNPVQQMIMLAKNGKNPQQMILQFLQQQNNPMAQNLLNLAQQGNGASIEQIARNLCASRGLDFDTEFTNFKKTLGL